MKKYIVKTGSDINNSNLLSFAPNKLKNKFVTDNRDEAEGVFNAEVTALAASRINENDLEYSPCDHEQSHGMYSEIFSFEMDEDLDFEKMTDEEWKEVEMVSEKCSDRFYTK